jgi:hypothetical protein
LQLRDRPAVATTFRNSAVAASDASTVRPHFHLYRSSGEGFDGVTASLARLAAAMQAAFRSISVMAFNLPSASSWTEILIMANSAWDLEHSPSVQDKRHWIRRQEYPGDSPGRLHHWIMGCLLADWVTNKTMVFRLS